MVEVEERREAPDNLVNLTRPFKYSALTRESAKQRMEMSRNEIPK